MQFFMYFYGWQLKQLYTAYFLYVFKSISKWRSSSGFPNLMVGNAYPPPPPPPQIQLAPGPDFR